MARDERFSFVFNGCPEKTFSVVSFKGTEGLSQLYEFHIELVSKRDDLEIDDANGGLATLILHCKGGDLPVHGVVAKFEQIRSVDGYVFYQAMLAPKLWRLTLTNHNQVFLDNSAPEFLAKILKDSRALIAGDFEFRLTKSYPKREYVCQFNESHYNFFARWLEREGMYYYFEQTEQGEKLIVTDSAIHHPRSGQAPLEYIQGWGLDTKKREEICSAFICEQNSLPGKVKVKDYNYRTPAVDLMAESDIDNSGVGEYYVYGDNFKTTEEAWRQTSIRAEEAKSRKKRYKGRSTAPFLRSGEGFTLKGHFRQDANTDYLPIRIKHEGNQTGFLMAGLGRCLSNREAKNFYNNSFVAIPADVQYRPPRRTPRPRFYGVVTAAIDAEGSGQYAELDEQGRYKVRLPFDLSNRPGGKASSWIRMAQPYGGAGYGMHFPLHKGTEVLLSFIDGDVDRPIITAAAPNAENMSIVKDRNAPANAIRSASGNQLVFGDKQGQEFVGMFSPFHKSGIAVGSTEPGGGGSITLSTEGSYDSLVLGDRNYAVVGGVNSFTGGADNTIVAGLNTNVTVGLGYDCDIASRVSYAKGERIHLGADAYSVGDKVTYSAMDSLRMAGGSIVAVGELKKKAVKALALGIGASVAAGAGAVLGGAGLDQSFLKDAVVAQHGAWMSGVGFGLEAVCGIALGTWAYTTTKGVVKEIDSATANNTSEMVLDKKGASLNVNTAGADNAAFVMTVKNIVERIGSIKCDSQNMTVYHRDDIEIESDAAMKMQAATTMKMQATGEMSLKASKVKIAIDKEALVGDLLKLNKAAGTVDIG